MTLNARNRLFKILFIISSSVLGLLLLTAILRMIFGKPVSLPDFDFSAITGVGSFLFTSMPYAALFSTICISIYAPIVSFLVRYSFEKTQSAEIVYFSVFIIGCLCEIFSLAIPVFSLWDSYSYLLLFIGRGAFAGRLLTLFSFLFAALFSQESQAQEADRNVIITIFLAVLFAAIIPVDTRTISDAMMVKTGFSTTFSAAKIALTVITFFTFFFTDRKMTGIGYLLLYGGYAVLITGSSVFTILLGGFMIVTGSKIYLNEIHTYYLWK
ncbi:MAG: hypothetical protein KBT02_11255 [Treponema sp.]|nr:hypothetical protein [Candidatus Treponema caballi]